MKSNMEAEKRTKCDEIYRSVLDLDLHLKSDPYNLFELAFCFMDGYDPDKLRQMLMSEDVGLVLDGLFVANEISSPLWRSYWPEIEVLTRSSDADVRREATRLAKLYVRSTPPSDGS